MVSLDTSNDKVSWYRGNRSDHAVQQLDTPLSRVNLRLISSAIISDDTQSVADCAMRTTSEPGQGPFAERTAALKTLFARLRTTAPPSFFPATHATRPSGSRPGGVAVTRAIKSCERILRAVLKTRSISRGDRMVLILNQALRTLRPLRLLAASTRRPPRVAIRARKPWVFDRFRLFGW